MKLNIGIDQEIMQIEYKRTFVLHPIILLEAAIAKRLVIHTPNEYVRIDSAFHFYFRLVLGLPQAGPSNSKDG